MAYSQHHDAEISDNVRQGRNATAKRILIRSMLIIVPAMVAVLLFA